MSASVLSWAGRSGPKGESRYARAAAACVASARMRLPILAGRVLLSPTLSFSAGRLFFAVCFFLLAWSIMPWSRGIATPVPPANHKNRPA